MPHHTTDDGCRIAYALTGPEHAPALVLSNSLGTDRGLWAAQIEALSRPLPRPQLRHPRAWRVGRAGRRLHAGAARPRRRVADGSRRAWRARTSAACRSAESPRCGSACTRPTACTGWCWPTPRPGSASVAIVERTDRPGAPRRTRRARRRSRWSGGSRRRSASRAGHGRAGCGRRSWPCRCRLPRLLRGAARRRPQGEASRVGAPCLVVTGDPRRRRRRRRRASGWPRRSPAPGCCGSRPRTCRTSSARRPSPRPSSTSCRVGG